MSFQQIVALIGLVFVLVVLAAAVLTDDRKGDRHDGL
jgi:hypothetical protein